jgi:hypothetical protein
MRNSNFGDVFRWQTTGGFVMKKLVIGVVVLVFISLCVPAKGSVIIEPANDFVTPGQFGFDLIINNPDGVSAQGFQTTIDVSGPGVLTLDETESQDVDEDLAYWVYGNSVSATAIDLGGGSYQFGDGPDDGLAELLVEDDIVARYVFGWDGTEGDYTFTIDFDTNESFVLNEYFLKEALEFTPGGYIGDSTSFTLHLVPEPVSLMLLALGSTALLKRRQ